MTLRNNEQRQAFEKWWKEYIVKYFPEQASKIDSNAMWLISVAYGEGIKEMYSRVQQALSFESTIETTTNIDYGFVK